MTELAIPEARPVAPYAAPAAQLPVPPANDVDSWIHIVREVVKLANEIYDTPFVPDGLRGSAAAVSACILAGREMGLGPMTSLANIDVIRGKPAQKPLLMRAMIQSRGHSWEDVEVNDTRVIVRGRRKGESEWTTATFTADQAKKAGLNLGNYPGDKLYARASSRLARRKFADVIMGIPYTPEDIEDGLDDDEIGTLTTTAPPAIEPAKPRTARRRQAATDASPAPAATPATAPPPPAQGAGEALPPLPGEEDEPGPAPSGQPAGNEPAAGPGSPGDERHRKLVGIVQAHFKRLEYGDDERDRRLEIAAVIATVDPITSLNDLLADELSTVADTLSRCRNRDALTALLVARDKAADDE
jgi:hypothetical protein